MCRSLNFSVDVLFSFFDAALLLIERYFELQVLIVYYKSGDVWWFSLTFLFICLPGAVFVLMNLISAIKFGFSAKFFKDGIMYGLLFPLTTLIR